MNWSAVPLKFKPNRVKRLYRGGGGIDRLRRAEVPVDSCFPEDWIASCIEGNTREFVAPGHGLSKADCNGREVIFKELLEHNAVAMLGPEHFARYGANPGVLTKLLDSAIRLPVQVHPTVADAEKYFNAPFGKTEAWIILSCRPDACLYLGFNENADCETFRQESKAGTYRHGLSMMHEIAVKPGDVVVVYGGLPHAIGAGITMIEVMEPSDLTINPESRCGDKEITPEKRFAGLPPDTALEIFDYTKYALTEIKRRCFPEPEEAGPGWYRLIDRKKVNFFEAQELRLSGEFDLPMSEKTFRIAVMVEGNVVINGTLSLCAGESAFLPYDLESCRLEGSGKIIFILPPAVETEKNSDE